MQFDYEIIPVFLALLDLPGVYKCGIDENYKMVRRDS